MPLGRKIRLYRFLQFCLIFVILDINKGAYFDVKCVQAEILWKIIIFFIPYRCKIAIIDLNSNLYILAPYYSKIENKLVLKYAYLLQTNIDTIRKFKSVLQTIYRDFSYFCLCQQLTTWSKNEKKAPWKLNLLVCDGCMYIGQVN